jgi:integrase/recombinase XerD
MANGIKNEKRPFKIPVTLTEVEWGLLLSMPNQRCPTGLRNACMLRLMLNLGLRASEVLNLEIRDIDWMSGKLMIRQGKNRRDRTLWLNEEDLDLLREWREKKPGGDLLFTTLDGGRINDRYLRAMVDRLAKKAGIEKNVHPHTLRHTFATDLYNQTKDIRMVQKALGHANIQTTTIYTHIIDDDLEEALRSLRNPV